MRLEMRLISFCIPGTSEIARLPKNVNIPTVMYREVICLLYEVHASWSLVVCQYATAITSVYWTQSVCMCALYPVAEIGCKLRCRIRWRPLECINKMSSHRAATVNPNTNTRTTKLCKCACKSENEVLFVLSIPRHESNDMVICVQRDGTQQIMNAITLPNEQK